MKERKAGKADGLNGCVAECRISGGAAVTDLLVRLLNICFRFVNSMVQLTG